MNHLIANIFLERISFINWGKLAPGPNPGSGGNNQTLSNLSTPSAALMLTTYVSQHLKLRQGWLVFVSMDNLEHQSDLK